MSNDRLFLQKERLHPTDIQVYKVIHCLYTGSTDVDIASYKDSQHGDIFRTARVTRTHDGSISSLPQPMHFFSLNLDMIYPLGGVRGQKYARASGFITWTSSCKLWRVDDASYGLQKPVVITMDDSDESKLRHKPFTQLPYDKPNSYLYYDGQKWTDCCSARLNICILKELSTDNVVWDEVTKY